MKTFCRVFLKGEPVRWFDFPIANAAAFLPFISQMRFEGFATTDRAYIALSEVAGAVVMEMPDSEQPIDFTKARAMQ